MQPRLSLVTLCVDDLERALRFYRDGLGLHGDGIVGQEFEHGAVAFFDLQSGLRLALWPRASLAHDTGLPVGAPGASAICLAHNVSSKAEVEAVIAQAAAAGGTIVKPPQATFWGGFAGYFKDPDGHLWEVAWNPAELPDESHEADSHEAVLGFWFGTLSEKDWWGKDLTLDARIAERWSGLLERAARCELADWRASARGRLAEVLVLDQFSRHIHRDRPQAWSNDPLALALAQEAVAHGADTALAPIERAFLYLPFMHSESAQVQRTSVALYAKLGLQGNLDFALRHQGIVDRFGRYPHRNAILGRGSTAEEIDFLKQPGSSF